MIGLRIVKWAEVQHSITIVGFKGFLDQMVHISVEGVEQWE